MKCAARSLATTGFALALAFGSVDAHAWCRTTTVRAEVPGECSDSGIPVSWYSLCAGFSLFWEGSPDVPIDQIATTAATAAARWHMAQCGSAGVEYFQLMPLGTTTTPTGYDAHGPNSNTVSFNSEWQMDAVHQLGTIAITLVTFDAMSGQILDADVEMNELSDANPDGFHFTVGAPDPASADLPTILTHEFGHFHGLGHTDIDTAVMWPQAGLGEQRRDLQPDDIAGICTVYPPDQVPMDRECNAVPYGGFANNPDGDSVRGGCATAPSRHGGSEGLLASIAAALALVIARRKR